MKWFLPFLLLIPLALSGATVNSGGQAMTAKIGDSAYVVPRIDPATHSLQTVDYEHHEIHSGSHYFVCGVIDLSINEVLDFTWQMPNTTEWTHFVFSLACEAETAWTIYENTVVTNGLTNTVTIMNSNRNSTNESTTTLKYEIQANLAAANVDTDVTGAILLESGIVGSGRRSQGNDERSREIIMKQNGLYCLRATASAAGYVNYCMQWYEHTDKD